MAGFSLSLAVCRLALMQNRPSENVRAQKNIYVNFWADSIASQSDRQANEKRTGKMKAE